MGSLGRRASRSIRKPEHPAGPVPTKGRSWSLDGAPDAGVDEMVRPASPRDHRRRGVVPALVVFLVGLLAAAAAAQAPMVPPGFDATPTIHQTASAPFVRAAVAIARRVHLIAIHGDVFAIERAHVPTGGPPPRPILSLANDDVSFLCADGAGTCWAGSLRRGWITRLDTATLQPTMRFAGPANAFDAAALPGGDLLLAANPLWPAPNASNGVWLVG